MQRETTEETTVQSKMVNWFKHFMIGVRFPRYVVQHFTPNRAQRRREIALYGTRPRNSKTRHDWNGWWNTRIKAVAA